MNPRRIITSAASILVLFTIACPGIAIGQIIPDPDDSDSRIQQSFLPAAGYTSDTGLFGGALYQRFNYSGDASPFLSVTRADMSASLRGEFVGKFSYERTRSFNRDIRNRTNLILFRSNISHFFGIGNNTPFSADLYDDDYYFFQNRRASVNWRLRKNVAEFGFEGKLDVFSELVLSYLDASPRQDFSSIVEESNDIGRRSGWTNMAGAGVIMDDRDSEFNPTEGFRYEAGIRYSNRVLASDFNYAELWLELRHYFEPIPGIVLAQKIRGEQIAGNAPFWELSTLGFEYGLRGFHLDRFRGERSILHILEARTWLLSFFDGELRIGGQLFWDSGRVFSEFDSDGFFSDWKHSFGAGGAISLFNPDLIIRADVGFSDEAVRIYAGIGYIF
jgi:outer membrane protein assembly factor BamA